MTNVKQVKIKKNTHPLDKGKAISANALGLFHQALAGLDESNEILLQHASKSEEAADAILRAAMAQADALRAEAKEAYHGVEANTAVRDKISSLLQV